VLIQVAVGPQQPGEIASEVVLSAYQRLVQLAYPNSLLSALGKYERHAGARETVFAALVSRNFGCTHFVVGRNRADRELFEQLGDIGITPVYFDEVCFSEEHGATVERNGHRTGLREFSTNRIREYLANSEPIPAWTMRDELANWLLAERTSGAPLFTHSD
jgi:ATP sulfurylase